MRLSNFVVVVVVVVVVVLFVGVVEASGDVDNPRVVAEKQQENYKSHLGFDYGEGSMGLYNWE